MKIIKRIFMIFLSLVAIFSCSFSVSAAQIRTTDSFTHRDVGAGERLTVSMPDVYKAEEIVDARSLGLEESYGMITDIDCDDDGNCYVLSEDGIIVIFDNNLKFVSYYKPVDSDGKEVDFSGSLGIYVTGNEVYIADTLHSRVLLCEDQVVKQEIIMPESALIPSDFVFSPTKVEKNSKGYLYVISKGSYYGAVMYDPEGEFVGFYGANTVTGSFLDSITNLWDRLTSNDIKRAKTLKSLPYQFVDIYIDNEDFVYTCTGLTSSANTTGQIRMLSPGGTNILQKRQYNGERSSSSSFNFGETDQDRRLNLKISQDFESIQVDEQGFIYALDVTYGLVYVYDTDCNLLSAFGGGRNNGTQKGVFTSAVSMTYANNKVYVADSIKNNVTVFQITDFGKTLLDAQSKTLKSEYTESKALWQEVLKNDSYNQLALRALAKIAFLEEDYKLSLKYAEEGLDYAIYGQALKKIQSDYIQNNFTWLFLGGIFLVVAIICALIYKKKKQIVLIKNERFKTFLNIFIHPFNSSNEIRYKEKGSLKIAIVMTILYFVSTVLAVLCSNFRYTSFDKNTFNSLFQIVQSVGLILLWSLANWAVSVLMQGIGKFKHVYIITSYSVLPLIIYNFISIVLSHLLTSPTSALLGMLEIVAMILTGVVLCVGLMIVHDFNFPRFLVSVVIGLFFMFLIIFVIFVFGILITQLWGFLVTLFMEVVYR